MHDPLAHSAYASTLTWATRTTSTTAAAIASVAYDFNDIYNLYHFFIDRFHQFFTTIAATPCAALSTTGPTVALHQLCALGCILGQMIFDQHPLQPCGLALPAVLRLRPREGLRPLRRDPSCIISHYVDFYHNSTVVNNTLANSFYCYDFNPAASEDLQGGRTDVGHMGHFHLLSDFTYLALWSMIFLNGT